MQGGLGSTQACSPPDWTIQGTRLSSPGVDYSSFCGRRYSAHSLLCTSVTILTAVLVSSRQHAEDLLRWALVDQVDLLLSHKFSHPPVLLKVQLQTVRETGVRVPFQSGFKSKSSWNGCTKGAGFMRSGVFWRVMTE